uniref:Uncharacterized protein n=1 Tax=Psilocybe cubensis TaxID=181762 RepID=A0A8H8CF06_PSICU
MSRCITPEDLLKDPSILLRKKGHDSSEGLCSFEGQVGAVVWEGSHFVTSPNMDHIWEPPRVSRITYMEDMRYGEHDPLQWPQPFIGSFCYLAAIRRRPDDLRAINRFFIVFYRLEDSDLLAQEGVLSGLYTLTPQLVSLAKNFVQNRVIAKSKEYESQDDAPKNDILLKLQPSILRTVNHLENLPMT